MKIFKVCNAVNIGPVNSDLFRVRFTFTSLLGIVNHLAPLKGKSFNRTATYFNHIFVWHPNQNTLLIPKEIREINVTSFILKHSLSSHRQLSCHFFRQSAGIVLQVS